MMLLCTFTGCTSLEYSDPSFSEKDWSYRNYGQSIKGQLGLKGVDVNIAQAWRIIQANDDVLVAVVDSGADYSVVQLSNSLELNDVDNIDGIDSDHNGYIDDYRGWNFSGNNNSIFESYLHDYHGTYICTTIARCAPMVSILPVKFLKGSKGTSKNATKAIEYAINRGAKIINCSWNFDEHNEKMFNVIKHNPNILFVCSAGNSNINLDESYSYPCSYDLQNIISVMAIDNRGKPYDASGFGLSVDIAAPGVDVSVILPENDEDYISGTSVAAAYVSAAAAMLLAENNSFTPDKIKKILIYSAHKTDGLFEKCSAEGFLDIGNALVTARNQQLLEL